MRCLYIIIVLCSLSSCNKNRYHLYSSNKEKCITVINENLNTRYIINGYVLSVPDTNYVKLDLTEIDKITNGIDGCWGEKEDYQWGVLLRNKIIIIENKLDTTKYRVYHKYKYDKNFKPVLNGFREDKTHCFGIHFNYSKFDSFYGDIILE